MVKRLPTTVDIVKKLVDSLLKGDQLKKSNFSVKITVWRTVMKTVFKFATSADLRKLWSLQGWSLQQNGL